MEKIKSQTVADAWSKCWGALDKDHRKFSLKLLDHLSRGHGVRLNELGSELGIEQRRLKKLVKKSPVCEFNADHLLMRHGPLQINPGPHIIMDGEVILYAPSAIECLILPHILAGRLQLRSHCHVSGEPVSVEMSSSGYETEEEDLQVSLSHPDRFSLEVLAGQSKVSHFFKNSELAQQWQQDREGVLVVPVSQAFQIGERIIAEVFGERK